MGPPPARRVGTTAADAGTNGDVFMTSPAPFGSTGVLLQAKPGWPFVVAKTGTSNAGSGFTVYNAANAELMRVQSDGRMGIGTTAPVHRLDVWGSPVLNAGVREVLGLYDTSAFAAGVGAAITLGGRYNSAGTMGQQFVSIQGIKENAVDGDYASAMIFNTRLNGGAPTARMRISSSGNVGIGVAIPTARLHVGGDIVATGSITGAKVIGAIFEDLAEWVPASADLSPGTVVVLSRTRINEVAASTRSYDTAVAGVVSAQPGLILGEASKTKEMIATTGRVRVRVDARSAPIAIGDLLVTSDTGGAAMRSEPLEIGGRKLHQPGTILGKALEPLAGGQGEILVLLSMQ